jgi:hypothetical protein
MKVSVLIDSSSAAVLCQFFFPDMELLATRYELSGPTHGAFVRPHAACNYTYVHPNLNYLGNLGCVGINFNVSCTIFCMTLRVYIHMHNHWRLTVPNVL